FIAYNQVLTTTGGTGTRTLTVSNIQTPVAGLVIPGSGVDTLTISGTPVVTGTETFTVTVTDSVGSSTSANLRITVNSRLRITTTTIDPFASVNNSAYNQAIATTGGTGQV